MIGIPLIACGGVERVDVHDERLPLEARLWVGGAEDAVSIARAQLHDERLDRDELEAWVDALPREAQVGAAAKGLIAPLRALAGARMDLADARVDQAEADLALALANRDLVYAETAMRYDLAVHDLTALRATRDEANTNLRARGEATSRAAVALDQLDGAFWKAYRAHAGNGQGDDTLVWLSARPKGRAKGAH